VARTRDGPEHDRAGRRSRSGRRDAGGLRADRAGRAVHRNAFVLANANPGRSAVAMKSTTLRLVFVLSLLANAGVLGAFGYRAIESGRWPGAGDDAFPGLTNYLALDAQQQRRWHEAEAEFLDRYR